ncbi:MAG: hypothetical protein Q8L24_00020 [bacterium]|nr:hypothetical protein [bacterium]
MSAEIHAKMTEDGLKYRVWSTVTGSYFTRELTEAEVEEWTRAEAVREAVTQHMREFPDRIARTKKNGTSSMMGDTRSINGPWDRQW